ncbi:hypothetical protein VNO77_44226 [Canavalia gladiata]|uniref:Uncharacterized protein n=1 Tax=Canavalia gladiata TaxID=3824 RepID=A0AAN9JXV4_CANGL
MVHCLRETNVGVALNWELRLHKHGSFHTIVLRLSMTVASLSRDPIDAAFRGLEKAIMAAHDLTYEPLATEPITAPSMFA